MCTLALLVNTDRLSSYWYELSYNYIGNDSVFIILRIALNCLTCISFRNNESAGDYDMFSSRKGTNVA